MTNTQQCDDDWTAPLRALIASVRELEHRFKNASEIIRRYRPDEEIGSFPDLEGLETTMSSGSLGVCEVMSRLAVYVTEDRAEKLRAEAEEAEKVRAETLRRQNQSPLEAKVEALERALAYQGAELAKLRGVQQPGHLPALPHVARSDVPQFLGMPAGMGRPPVIGSRDGGVRMIGKIDGASAPDAMGAGFTRRQHPLEVLGGGPARR